jgi:hypothetical protein
VVLVFRFVLSFLVDLVVLWDPLALVALLDLAVRHAHVFHFYRLFLADLAFPFHLIIKMISLKNT